MVQWMDVNQLSQEENLHSKCLCINRLPLDLSDSEELAQFFSETYKPVFCQVSIFCPSHLDLQYVSLRDQHLVKGVTEVVGLLFFDTRPFSFLHTVYWQAQISKEGRV